MEIFNLAETMGKQLSDRELDVAMEQMDADGSGEVDLDEFTEWYNRMRKRGDMPSFVSDFHKSLRRGGGDGKRGRDSIKSQAAQDQKSAMAMRGR